MLLATSLVTENQIFRFPTIGKDMLGAVAVTWTLLAVVGNAYAAPTVVTELTASWNETPLLMEARYVQ